MHPPCKYTQDAFKHKLKVTLAEKYVGVLIYLFYFCLKWFIIYFVTLCSSPVSHSAVSSVLKCPVCIKPAAAAAAAARA